MEREQHALPEVSLVITQICAVEAPQDQVMVHVVPCVPYRHVLEQKTVCAQYELRFYKQIPSKLIIFFVI